MIDFRIDPQLDLVLERAVDVPPERVWAAWTEPEQLKRWFTPAPWQTVECEMDLRPGGAFRTVMRSPEGEDHETVGCFLEIVPNTRLVWTDALLPGYRPAPPPAYGFAFTGAVLLKPHGAGTHYTAIAIHRDPDARASHDAMGFRDGWGRALDQLVAHAKSL